MPAGHKELQSWGDWTDPDFFTEGKHKENRPVQLFLRQMVSTRVQQTKLTITGWMLILVSLGIGSAAYNTASNILFMTLSLLLSSLILSGILSLVNFKKLKWDLEAPRHLEATEMGLAKILVRNEKSVFPSLCLRFRTSHSMKSGEDYLYLPRALPAGENLVIEWPFTPEKRGICELNLNGVQSKFPFGFLAKTVGEVEAANVVVWPARVDYSFKPDANGYFSSAGATQTRKGLGNDLLKIREYIPGDAPNLIHWKATARTNRLMVRELAQEGQTGFHIVIDRDANQWSETQFEVLCSLAYSLADDLFHRDRLQTARINGHELLKMRSIRDLHEFFDLLASVDRLSSEPSNTERAIARNEITFKLQQDGNVAIYVDGIRTGETQL